MMVRAKEEAAEATEKEDAVVAIAEAAKLERRAAKELSWTRTDDAGSSLMDSSRGRSSPSPGACADAGMGPSSEGPGPSRGRGSGAGRRGRGMGTSPSHRPGVSKTKSQRARVTNICSVCRNAKTDGRPHSLSDQGPTSIITDAPVPSPTANETNATITYDDPANGDVMKDDDGR